MCKKPPKQKSANSDCSLYTNTHRYTYSYTKFSTKVSLSVVMQSYTCKKEIPSIKTQCPRYTTFPAGDLPPSKGTYLLPVVLGIGRSTLMRIPLLRIYCLATAPCFISIFKRFHFCLVLQYRGFGRLANKAEELETG